MNPPEELEPDLRGLLDVERASPELDEGRRDEIRARLESAIAAGAHAAPSAMPPSGALSPLVKGALLFLGGGAVGAFVYAQLAPPAPPPPPVPSATTAPSVLSVPSPPAPPTPPATPGSAATLPAPPPPAASRAPAAPPAAPANASPAPSASAIPSAPLAADAGGRAGAATLAEERALVERGRAAIARRDGVSALEAFRDHARRFPNGQLAEERDALTVVALALAGRADDARARARAFDAKYPGSVFGPTIEATLDQLP